MKNSFMIALTIVAAMWMVFILNQLVGLDFNQFGIIPRQTEGIKGILFAPFLHGSLAHIISNTVPMLVLTTVLFWFYRKIAIRILILSTIAGGGLVWIFGRSAFHIGASGVVFALVGFLIASGIFRRKIKALLLAIVIFFLYGGVVWGILPTQPGVSWESHLFGFLSGIVLAYIFRSSNV
ncbi:MAG: rhomboid family intramembrane serine protease [Bacteroidales bacterium]|nr:rhomboid family intramembrane serine protease [Bacteroidales bacterium]